MTILTRARRGSFIVCAGQGHNRGLDRTASCGGGPCVDSCARARTGIPRRRWSILRGMSPSLRRRPPARRPAGPVHGHDPAPGRPEPSGAAGRPRAGAPPHPRAHHARCCCSAPRTRARPLLTAAGLAVAAALAGRPGREVGLVLATVLVGQAVLGWHNDLVDRRRDAQRLPSGKPIADGYLDPGTAWFALVCGVLLLVPLAGLERRHRRLPLPRARSRSACSATWSLRGGLLSWLPWAASFALYPAFLSYGGWGGQALGNPPEVAMVVLAAALGVGVHVLCALPGPGRRPRGRRPAPAAADRAEDRRDPAAGARPDLDGARPGRRCSSSATPSASASDLERRPAPRPGPDR